MSASPPLLEIPKGTEPTASPPQCLSPEVVSALRDQALGDLFFFAKGVLGLSRLTSAIHRPLCRLLELYGPFEDLHLRAPWEEYAGVLRDALRRMGIVEEEEVKRRLAEYRAKGVLRLLIMLPRTWYKTTLGSIAYSLWRGVRDSSHRVLLTQNTSKNAVAKGNAIAGHVDKGEVFRLLFPECIPTPREQWSADGRTLPREKVLAEPTFKFAGIRTQVTSGHFNEIIEDDTVAPDKDDLGEESILPSTLDVEQAIGWHRLVPPLLDEYATDRNIITGTRWFVHDLISWVVKNEPDFLVYQRAVREGKNGLPDPKGALTWPERFGEKELAGIAAALGPYLFSCLYMNTPVRSEDMLFKPEWIRYYDVEPPRSNLMTFTTVDLATDPVDCVGLPDYNVVLTCGKSLTDGKIFVLDYSRERCSPSRVLELIYEHVQRWSPATVGIETVAYQKSLMHWVRQYQISTGRFFLVTELRHTKVSKAMKIRGLQPAVSAGVLFFRSWMKALVNELLIYPLSGKNDDLADALAMQLELWRIVPSHEEEAKRAVSGPNDFDTVLERCGIEQRRQNAERAARSHRPPPAWGLSTPIVVFEPPGVSTRLTPRGTPQWWGRERRLSPVAGSKAL